MTRRCTVLLGSALLAPGCAAKSENPPSDRRAIPPSVGDRGRVRDPKILEQVTAGVPELLTCERDEQARVYCGKAFEEERSLVPELDGAQGLAGTQRVVCANVRGERVVCFAPSSGDFVAVDGLGQPEFIYRDHVRVCTISEGRASCFDPERPTTPFEASPAAPIAALVPGRASMHFLDRSGRLCHDVACERVLEQAPALLDAALVHWDMGCGIDVDQRVVCWRTGWGNDQHGNPMEATDVEPRDDIVGARSIAVIGGAGDDEEGHAQSRYACALTDAEEVWCFGDPGEGEAAPGTEPGRDAAQRVDLPAVRRLSTIAGAICADLQSGPRHCWGQIGRLRPGSFEDGSGPR